MIALNKEELIIFNQIINLKKHSGSHSPSLATIKESIPSLKITIDACFLSNPYATDLFIENFKKDLLGIDFNLREMLEFYPSQNNVIASLISTFLDLPSENVFIGNGAIEIIQACIHNLTKNKILINIPTFSSYYEFVKPGVEVVFNKLSKENGFKLVIDSYIDLVKNEKPDTIVLINPNNPDGGYFTKNELINILDNLSFVQNIILDESFIHFAFEGDNLELVDNSKLILKYPNLIIIKSMSKDFGIAGIRSGYALMSKSNVSKIMNHGYLWNSNGLSEYFFRLYITKQFQLDYKIAREKYIKDTISYTQELNKIKQIRTYPTFANFVLFELHESMKADEFAFGLLAKTGIYTRTCSDKIGLENGEYIRIASRTKAENENIVSSLKNIFN